MISVIKIWLGLMTILACLILAFYLLGMGLMWVFNTFGNIGYFIIIFCVCSIVFIPIAITINNLPKRDKTNIGVRGIK